MLRQIAIPAIRSSLRTSSILPARRLLSYTAVRMGEGDTGGVRSGGSVAGDAFTRREDAAETKYMKENELRKLHELKIKIAEHKKQLQELDKNVEDTINEGKKGNTFSD